MVRVQGRISVGMDVLQYFTMRNWYFKTERAQALTADMNERDKQIFYLANIEYDVDEYLVNIVLGARQFCMKEPLSSMPTARKHLMWYVHHLYQQETTVMCASFGFQRSDRVSTPGLRTT